LHKTETSFIVDHRCADDPAQNQNFEVTPVPSMACPVSPGCTVGVTPDQFVTVFEDLADRLDRLGERHHGKPVAIKVKLAAASDVDDPSRKGAAD
jgi:hypothetical protein